MAHGVCKAEGQQQPDKEAGGPPIQYVMLSATTSKKLKRGAGYNSNTRRAPAR
ncbi:hypothetical protein FOXG_21555 [Fusarium oxysporum f. sp. lycopersici 4287]|uniref:Uncharacterized protein n=1 Tax=Fusarium oxysporum f. sp. lycopersici (strain 4287 / CBS 123668 / FGSC 9935 / NRRL 34936) TaxID=426428 RepID=A0A0J9VZN4_FUSO4|nr:hypothetical protein FOXG_21555 [Fusarium oxysporum f. sp. lycopersici 4287]EWZ78227.1 hypothetical protein FOWG_17463 [Fusarium oxysporum f. sp. lycopersici MN25]KNB15990.1 hypothetical protein FOXG_21555 [Fusarium oxysporum f. sp. lycopersici 4287]